MPPAVTIMPFAGDDLGAGADHDVDARLDVGIAGLAELAIRPSLIAMSPLTMPHQSMTSALVITVSAQSFASALALPHAVADHLAAAELHLLAVDREIALDLDDEVGVGEPHAIADRRPEHLGVGAPADLHRRPPALPCRPRASSSPARAARRRRARRVERPHHRAREAVDDALAGERDELDRARLPGLEAHRGAGRDVEPEAARRRAIERERRVGLGEVIVRADLDRPVAGVRDRQRDRRAARR